MRDFCDWDWLQRKSMGSSPVDRDPGLAALNIQLPGGIWAWLSGVGEEGARQLGHGVLVQWCLQHSVDVGQVMPHSLVSALSPLQQGSWTT